MPKSRPATKAKARARTEVSRKRRPRRSTEEIIDRLLEAAGEEFERNGYGGTTTAEIARRAGVAEWLIFNHFGSKARLFEDSIFKPLNRHFLEFCASNPAAADDPEGIRRESHRYILELQRFIERHSRMLVSLLVARIYDFDNVEGLSRLDGLHEYFSRGAAMRMNRRSGKGQIDPKLMARISFATIASCVVFKDLLFPPGMASDAEIDAALGAYVVDGINANVGVVTQR
jgi:AcrR family transcriptional regulator